MRHQISDLYQMQLLSLESKIIMTQHRIRRWYDHYDGDVYVSFSGGKDSTVLLDIVRNTPGVYDVPAVFADTGLEFPEIREFVRTFDDVTIMWKFLVKNQSIEILEREMLADHQIQYVQFKFVFDGDWKRFHKVVQFSQCDEVYSIVLGTDGTSCYLPAELHVGAVKMGIYGYDTASDTTVRATTVPVTLNIRESGFEGDEPPIPPTPDLYTQLLKRIEDAEHGLDGKSAYEIAVEHGYVGTEEEWLASLHGKDGITPDMSEYPKTSEVTTIIEREIAPVAEDSHTHDNKETLDAITPELFTDLSGLQQFEDSTKHDIQTLNEAVDNLRQGQHTHNNMAVLDATTAPYTTEEQQKLAGISPETYATTEALEAEALSIREAMIPLTRELHSHTNKAVLDAITAIDTHLDENSSNPVANYVLALAIDVLNTAKHTHGNAGTLDKITEQMLTAMQDFGPFEDWTREQIHTLFEDIGFTGIANITAAYQYTHVDVRPNGKWYGDEVHGNSTVTDDFYKYFGGEDMKGIDVSVHNGNIDWQKVKNAGIDFAILRAGYGRLASQKDERFEQNYSGAKAAGVPVSAYWYSYAMSEDEARLEADVFLSIIKGKQFEFPVYYDVEEKKQFALGKEKVSAIMRAFLAKVEAAGYFVGLYGSASSLTTHTADDIKSRYTIWLAHWVNQTSYGGAYGIWQHSEKGRVDGINGNVDLDIGYKDFPTIIKGKGLNGYGKEKALTNPPAHVSDDGISVEVTVDGKKYSGKLNKA